VGRRLSPAPELEAPGPNFEAAKAKGKTFWIIPVSSQIPIIPLVDGATKEALAQVGSRSRAWPPAMGGARCVAAACCIA
jgi:hypothetical protein